MRHRPQQAQAGALHCFVLDCSGSMLQGQQLARVKGALQQLIHRAYQRRDRVALVTFAGAGARVQIAPTAALPLASLQPRQWLHAIDAGGGTPLQQGVDLATTLLARAAREQPAQQQWLWLLSDGRSAQLPPRPHSADVLMVVDCEWQRVTLGRCRELARHWQADYRTLEQLLI